MLSTDALSAPAGPHARRLVLRLRLDDTLRIVLVAGLAGTALAAYNVAGVPVQWLAQAMLAAAGLLWLALVGRVISPVRALLFAAFLLWAFTVNVVNLADFAGRMPRFATLPYDVFVVMRYLAVLAYASTFWVTLWLARRGHAERLLRAVVWVGILVCLAAIYIHVAQWLGLPEPARSRLGTGGDQQAVTFSSGTLFYRRALGTFREPSHLAEWLLLPLFLGSGLGGRLGLAGTALAAIVMLLTVSLTGLLSAAAGFLGGLFLLNPLRRRNHQLLIAVALLIGLAVIVFRQVPVGTADEPLSLADVIEQRVESVVTSGLEASSRSIWIDLLSRDPVPFFGYGFGNANIVASERVNSDLVVSFLSVYANTLYATGVIGLTLLFLFLGYPLVRRGRLRNRAGQAALMSYVAFLVAFAGGSEELSVPFGVVAGLLEYYRRVPPIDSSSASVRRAEFAQE